MAWSEEHKPTENWRRRNGMMVRMKNDLDVASPRSEEWLDSLLLLSLLLGEEVDGMSASH